MGTTKQTTQQQGFNTSTNTPTEAANVTQFRNSLYPQISQMFAQAYAVQLRNPTEKLFQS